MFVNLLRRQGTHRSSGSRGSSEDDPPFIAGGDTAGVAKRQRRMAEKNRYGLPHQLVCLLARSQLHSASDLGEKQGSTCSGTQATKTS